MMKIKIFTDTNLERLEKEVNYFLEESLVEVTNTRFKVEGCRYYIILTYRKKGETF